MSAKTTSTAASVKWPGITALLASEGHITIGCIPPIEGAAIAATGDALLATLVHREGESFDELLQRLDHAVRLALDEGVLTNEIEDGRFVLASPRSRRRGVNRV